MHVTLDQLDEATSRARSRGHLRAAEQLLGWAGRVSADSEVSRAELLLAASDQYGLAGDVDRQVDLCRQAVADGGRVHPDARCYLVAALLDAGRDDEAQPYIEALRSDPSRHVHVDEFLGETLEAAGRLLEAVAVLTAGHARAKRTAPAEAALLLQGRRRCREALGWPPDALDRAALRALDRARPRTPPPDPGRVEPLPGEPEREIVVFLPEEEWSAADAELDPGFESFDAQRLFIERGLRASTEGLPRVCVPLDRGGLTAFAAAHGRAPADAGARLAYGLHQVRAGAGRPWPPGRNEPCWCGRPAKYKKCCGRADLSH